MVIHDLQKHSLCHWFAAIRLSRLIALLLLVLVMVPLFTHYYLSKFVGDNSTSEIHHKGIQLDNLISVKSTDLKVRIEEMLRIKTSVSNELRDLESRRQKLQTEIAVLSQRVEDLKAEYSHQQIELERLRLSVEQAQYAQKEMLEKNTPQISAPRRILPSAADSKIIPLPSVSVVRNCRMHLCFDFSRCSVLSEFPVYFYHPDDYRLSWNQLDRFIKISVTEALNMNVHITFDPTIACVYVVLVGEVQQGDQSKSALENYLKNLAHWNGDGRNHILLNLARNTNVTDMFSGVNTGRAILVQSHFSAMQFREGFDIISPPVIGPVKGEVWEKLLPHCPIRRTYLLSYQGMYRTRQHNSITQSRKLLNNHVNQTAPIRKLFQDDDDDDIDSGDDFIVESLKGMQSGSTEDKFNFQFSCVSQNIFNTEWSLCDTPDSRTSLLSQSTFTLIVASADYELISTTDLQWRLFESLKTGAIPIILGNHIRLPFHEVIDWNKCAMILPKARVTELHYILRTISDSDILAMRRQGRLLWERYMSTTQQIINTILAIARQRIQIPPSAAQDEPSPSVFNATFQPLKLDVAAVQDSEPEENLGPLEPPLPTPKFYRNITFITTQQYEIWNDLIDPFTLYPYTPFDPILSSEAKFLGSGFGFRPIGQGAGGSGKEFSEALGGNVPREQFTVVMLTYEREAVLIDSLQRLRGLPFLNKVVVVWNSPRPPASDLHWPEIGVPIHVIKAKKNSLNNRFLPYDTIETEAILSMDDDAHLRHDEIIFGFRVWRESRDRIVGFPGRYHAWDPQHESWLYNSNYSCELSMVLTGAAFFHKYYSYLYSHWMAQAIRDKVDEYMNCEDIAMNFLVSHVTRKPPIKVTSRWTFRCPGCPISLSEEDSHFQERHKCINFFIRVYGYMPLLNTQFRVDSVLFKTRIPHDKQKCFKFI